MAKIISSTETVELNGLGVSVEAPEGGFYVAVDADGSCYAYGDKPYCDCGFWDCYGGTEFLCKIELESDEERALCEQMVWNVGE